MSNRYGYNNANSLEPGLFRIFAEVTIGASGACTLVAAKSRGVTSITRNAAGKYTVVFQDRYNFFKSFTLVTKNATGISAAPDVGFLTETMNASTKNFVFQMSSGGLATDPASGDRLYLRWVMKNSSV